MADKKTKCCLEGCNKKLKIIDLTITCRCGNQYCKGRCGKDCIFGRGGKKARPHGPEQCLIS